MTQPTKEAWQQALSNVITDQHELYELLELPCEAIAAPKNSFPLRVPRSFVNRMQKGNPRDPLLLQVLIQADEFLPQTGFVTDPLNESAVNPTPGLLHKYHGRVLLILSGACAINCRYCFRRHFNYSENFTNQKNIQAALEYIANDPTITEVILSGGDPLILKDHQLTNLFSELNKISHIKRIRIHTRLPIVIPDRITESLVRCLKNNRTQSVIVFHINHAQEINMEVQKTVELLRLAGISLLNQAVLLKDVNDNIESLISLNERLFEIGILPYYLHILDRVAGAAHFEISEDKIQNLYTALRERQPGYLVPKLVREFPGVPYKVPA